MVRNKINDTEDDMKMAALAKEHKIVSKPSLETKMKWCTHSTRELWIGDFIPSPVLCVRQDWEHHRI